ncbi:MAG: hypothetical protein Q9M36_13850 [Sulfurovum sp.]|nr:hypothetical protein [Sulfurovum sp.]
MSYTIVEQDLYLKACKKLSKKYKNIESDVENFLLNLTSLDDLGIELKNNVVQGTNTIEINTSNFNHSNDIKNIVTLLDYAPSNFLMQIQDRLEQFKKLSII